MHAAPRWGLAVALLISLSAAALPGPAEEASAILAEAGVKGGLVVHLGCGDGTLTAALRASESYVVHGLDATAANVAAARKHIQAQGLYGPVCVDRLSSSRLPYIDNLVNLVVAETLGDVPQAEVMRVLCPGGVACVRKGKGWAKTVKPRPKALDEWTHYLHDAGNNPVAHDTVVGPPRRLQWTGSPRYGRHHDRMSSVSAAVSTGGRIFYILDEASRFSILVAPQWRLIARDAFNGTILWKRPIANWHTHLFGLKSGPALLPRRLVALGDRVYVTLGLDAPLTALDAATGETMHTYKGTEATREVLLSDGVLYLVADPAGRAAPSPPPKGRGRAGQGAWWAEGQKRIMALKADTGDVVWTADRWIAPLTLAADSRSVYFCCRDRIVCLHRATGKPAWESEPVPRAASFPSYFTPTLIVEDGVVLFAGGETAAKKARTWYTEGEDTLTALSATTGKVLWSAYHPPSGYASPEDVFVTNGQVWTGESTSGRAVGVFTGRDLHTGKVQSEFPPDVKTYWFHHRCHRGKATDNYLLTSRAGIEFIDFRAKKWITNHWVRGACLYGVMPANGLIYAPQHPCACYLESKLSGFNALAPEGRGARVEGRGGNPERLERGSAYSQPLVTRPSTLDPSADWPTYRRDSTRSGHTKTTVPTGVKPQWTAELGGKLTSPVVADGRLLVASVDTHTVHALDAKSGKRLWHTTAGGRVDSPPTVWQGRVLFGSADGHVYCLRASDGALAWRFRAAPADERLMSFEQIESVWPVHGNILVHGGVASFVAGRSMFLDGGLRLYRLDPTTGKMLSATTLSNREEGTDKGHQEFVSWLNMPTALPDVLSCDGRFLYMRGQPFTLEGTRLPLKAMPRGANADAGAPPATQTPEHAHLFSPTGFVDDSWWHRTYWLYGSTFVSGWCGYYRSGKATPSGRILVFDDQRVCGFGRKPRYYRWTTPIEHHLFTADRAVRKPDRRGEAAPGATRVRVAKSKSLDCAAKALSVAAWVKPERPTGVVVARGGMNQGYALYLDDGRPRFAVRSATKLAVASARRKLPEGWVHLAGVLTDDKKVQVYVGGRLAATAKTPRFIAADPLEAMEIGADDETCVGPYGGPLGFGGLIDEVRVYDRALSPAEVAAAARPAEPNAAAAPKPVLAFSFDDGKAQDASGNGNHGTVENAKAVAGKVGKALEFKGGGGASRAAGFDFTHQWTADVPLFARGMVLAGDTLSIAGPPDTVDEQALFRRATNPDTQETLADYAAALAGKKGAVLWAVGTADGQKLAELPLDAPPVFDGLIAAQAHLYLTLTNGKIVCLGRK